MSGRYGLKGDAARRAVLVVAGPTASGKSALALDLAEAFDGVIINGDSMQVYDTLSILTNRPGAADEARAPHRLYGVIPPDEACSAARWRGLALAEIAEAHDSGRLPIVTGGSGLYIRALIEGLAPVPDIPAEVRRRVRDRHAKLGGPAFHAALSAVDGAMAARLDAGDSQRLIRAMEVFEATGRSLTYWQDLAADELKEPVLTLALTPPREALYAAIDARFSAMIEAGALDEVRALLALGLDASLPAMKALGVVPLSRHLAGETRLADAIDASRRATRNYAKRQLTWLRHQMKQAVVYEQCYGDRIARAAIEETRRFLEQYPIGLNHSGSSQ